MVVEALCAGCFMSLYIGKIQSFRIFIGGGRVTKECLQPSGATATHWMKNLGTLVVM